MKAHVIRQTLPVPFGQLYGALKKRIVDHDFLLLHEIDTQAIVAKHGVRIAPLRQLLFFHPKYIAEIMANDPLAINDIPLKLVLHQLDDTTTQLSFKNPVQSLQDYGLKPEMAAELLKRVQGILSF
ncbi:DUF302 domain-containing protein [Flagellimonas zhangzhouensis]|uniref:Uncharacterized conserved protein, DUF302 family n=1 Tax=Flagellimonas zhangzhouensis TaxID=1073328 RepID=A0A1H2SH67_9FLAO|nr:DUF302 domain-containing protein [Allomuricauda zhangzhouensis]SDQ74646.1 Uncharacterized conserved protein, DUF302 family [Allomuricauda zhangzhouensis]SDW30855.1 Uncharacterized conserved protein, DUF302 family [Allomuricauda zhangzhouensis]